MGAIPLERGIEYPTSDGQPMAESSHHQVEEACAKAEERIQALEEELRGLGGESGR